MFPPLYWALFRSKLVLEETIQCAFTTKGGSLQLQRDLIVLQYRHINKPAHIYILTIQDQVTPWPSTAFGSMSATHSLSPETPNTGYAISPWPLLTTPSLKPHVCVRVLGHFPTSVDSAYYSTPTQHGGVSTPTGQPSAQRFSMDYYPRSIFWNILHTTHHATDLHWALMLTS
jgi:hypothetical protein